MATEMADRIAGLERENETLRQYARGGTLIYPPGYMLVVENGQDVRKPNVDIAREVCDAMKPGQVLILPNNRDYMGEYCWQWIPNAPGDLSITAKRREEIEALPNPEPDLLLVAAVVAGS